jgi:hypothetical protein
MEAILQAHISPQTDLQDILPILEQAQITDNQLNILSGQTGLNPRIIRKILNRGETQLLFRLQQGYFAPVRIDNDSSTPLTISEHLVDDRGRRVTGMPLVDLQDGDILITKNSWIGPAENARSLWICKGSIVVLQAHIDTIFLLSITES